MRYIPQIVIQEGDWKKSPLFCVPGAGASVTAFLELANALGCRLPVYGFQHRGLDGLCEPFLSVGAAASGFVEAMLETQPREPYQLVGHSFGGWIALEMARKLSHLGKKVGAVFILDSKAPEPQSASIKFTRAQCLSKLINLLELRHEGARGLENELDLTSENAVGKLRDVLVRNSFLPARISVHEVQGIVNVFEANLNSGYAPSDAYRGQAYYIGAKDKAGSEDESEGDGAFFSAWLRCAENMKFSDCPGNHVTMLMQPHVASLAAKLQECLSSYCR